MVERAHFELSPSSAHRWMRCPGSVYASRGIEDQSSEAADEGTLAHEIAAEVLSHQHRETYGYKVKKHPSAGKLEELSAGNIDALQTYVDYVVERYQQGGCLLYVEIELDLSPWLGEGGFGTSDAILYLPKQKMLSTIDLKFGRGNLVFANEREGDLLVPNPQLGAYGLGSYKIFEHFDVDTVELVIHQPRRDHISVAAMSTERLHLFGDDLKLAAKRVLNEPFAMVPGEKQCKWCPVRATCAARADWHLEAFAQEINTLTAADLDRYLAQVDDMRAWCDALEQRAMSVLTNDPQALPGWKLVEGRSVRKLSSDAPEFLERMGFDPYEKKLVALSTIERWLGKKQFAEIVDQITVKPPGKPTLVPATDPRPPFQHALDGFNIETGD